VFVVSVYFVTTQSGNFWLVVVVVVVVVVIPWRRVLLQTLRVNQLVKEFPPFMEPEDLLQCLKEPATDIFLWQMNPDNFPPYFSKILSNIILPSTPRTSDWSLPFKFSGQNVVCISHLSHACYVPHQSQPS
jgi:hypothetical protein